MIKIHGAPIHVMLRPRTVSRVLIMIQCQISTRKLKQSPFLLHLGLVFCWVGVFSYIFLLVG